MEDRSTTPDIAIIKNEEESTIQNQSLTSKPTTLAPPINHPNGPRSVVPFTSNPSAPPAPHALELLEIELHPRFQAILDREIRKDPNLVHQRYNQFLNVETNLRKAPVEGSDQIKLYFSSANQS
jgi:hypothetical protein